MPARSRRRACGDDGNQCTSDTCDGAGHCQHADLTGTCNDGNACTPDDTCIAGQCVGTVQPDGTPCNDGNACTTGDHCAGGACVVDPVVCPSCEACDVTQGCVPTISTGCREAPAGSVVLQRLSSDSLSWKWQRGEAIDEAEFGDPTTTTDYEFCVYDGNLGAAGVPGLVVSAAAPAGGSWRPAPGGFAYASPDIAHDALRRIRLKGRSAGRSSIVVRGRGSHLALPPLQSIARPLTVQLKSRDGENAHCWSAVYDPPADHGPQLFRAKRRPVRPGTRPNILIINLDDTRADGIDRMPTLTQLASEGVTFTNSFATNPLCAPSRASLLTGLYGPHHGVRALGGVLGGAHTFRLAGSDRQTMATWLQAAGYMTGLFGKYINGYGSGTEGTQGPGGTVYVPPGWTRWRGMTSSEHFGGVRGPSYTLIDEHGTPTLYDDHSSDRQYSTDLLAAELRAFIADAAGQGRPFMAVWTPYASHADIPSFRPEPAARHHQFFRALAPWRPESYIEADLSDKPRYLQQGQGNLFALIVLCDAIRIGAYETLLSVDEQLHVLLDDLVRLGIDANTVIMLTSDNGFAWGEHGLFFHKECPYEECLRVPMIVRDGRGGGGVVYDAAVLTVDVAPTVAELAGVAPPVPTDGTSFASWITGAPPPQWRDDFLIEHWRTGRNDGLNYSGQITDGDQVRVSYGDTRHQPRPSVLFEFDAGDGVAAGAEAVSIAADADGSFANLRAAVIASVPQAGVLHTPATNALVIVDASPDRAGVYILVERDQGEVIAHTYPNGDWFGVRDVTRGLTYVEHEGGEVELYDLNVDPTQLDNRADDPAYATTRQSLAVRLADLLQ